MSDETNEHYIAIARACLKAINTASEQPRDRADQIQHVYHAIEHAFQEQTRPLEQRTKILAEALEAIAANNLSREDMVAQARAALGADKEKNKHAPLH